MIYSLQPRDISIDTGQAKQREWHMDIAHSCSFKSYFDLLTSIDPAIEAEWNRTGAWKGVHLKAGQLVGHIGAQTLDFGVYDYGITLPGFVVPSHYDSEPWKVHTVDPFPYFPEGIRDALLQKMLRHVEPRAGKIDHDVDGRLVGNWFQRGTNGYKGLNPSRYWDGHRAFVPDAIDPSRWIFSAGNFSGEARSFALAGVDGNAPDPSVVSTETGLVKYQLVQAPGMTPSPPTGQLQTFGVVLVQMTGTRTLKCEAFPGKSASEVAGFTALAKMYER